MLQIVALDSKLLRSLLLTGILWLSWLTGACSPVRAETTSIRVQPEASTVQVGQTIDIQFVIQDVADLYGIDIQIDYDALLLEVVDVDANRTGIQVAGGQFPYPDFVAENDADNSTGTIRYVVTQLNPRDPAAGSGTIMTVRFKGIAVGTSVLEIQRADLVTASALQIDAQISWGELTVEGSAGGMTTPSPTAVVIPTLTPTTQGGTATVSQPTATSSAGAYPSAQITNTPAAPAQATATPAPPQTTAIPATAYPSGPTLPVAPQPPRFTMAPRPAVTRATVLPEFSQPSSTAEASAIRTTPSQGETLAPQATLAPALEPTTGPAAMFTTPFPTEPVQLSPTPTRAKPLIPQDLFICLSVTLFLFTTALAYYLVRRQVRQQP